MTTTRTSSILKYDIETTTSLRNQLSFRRISTNLERKSTSQGPHHLTVVEVLFHE